MRLCSNCNRRTISVFMMMMMMMLSSAQRLKYVCDTKGEVPLNSHNVSVLLVPQHNRVEVWKSDSAIRPWYFIVSIYFILYTDIDILWTCIGLHLTITSYSKHFAYLSNIKTLFVLIQSKRLLLASVRTLRAARRRWCRKCTCCQLSALGRRSSRIRQSSHCSRPYSMSTACSQRSSMRSMTLSDDDDR